MTEESPVKGVDGYRFPEKYFSKLREYDERGCDRFYGFVSGRLYRDLDDYGFSKFDALEISELLVDRRIDEAEDFVYERLEQ